MTPFWLCIALFAAGLVMAFAFAGRAQRKARKFADMATVLADELEIADRQIAAQAAACFQQRQENTRLRDRLAPFERERGEGGKFTGRAA